MSSELINVAVVAQQALVAQTPGKAATGHKRALALAGGSSCRSLYKLKKIDFSKFTTQHNIAIATKLLARSARWAAAIKNKKPTTRAYLELRFFVDSFTKIAKDSGALTLYKAFATPMNVPKNATSKQVRRGIKRFRSDLQRAKKLLPSTYATYIASLNKLIGVVDTLAKSAYLAQGWAWLVASDRVIKANLAHCK